jgi:phosphopantothenoylcysteine decarboxylase/phosphopantothenate--cysteine ligase
MQGNVIVLVDGPAVLLRVPALLNGLRAEGLAVTVASSESANVFMPPLAYSALSGRASLSFSALDSERLGKADLVLAAPLSLQLLELLAGEGWAERRQALKRPILVAPALLPADQQTQFLDQLVERIGPQFELIRPAGEAELLGALGAICAPSAEQCLETALTALTPPDCQDMRLLITAGPTAEDADPARYVTNRSTGRMGVALAQKAARRGAKVLLVHGPMSWPLPLHASIECCAVRSAQQMYDAVMARLPEHNAAILCAAVADYAPVAYSHEKIKKGPASDFSLLLRRTPDILATLGAMPSRPFLVGFAAETHEVEAYAREKLYRKGCDMLCANDISEAGSGFAVATNRITVHLRDGDSIELPMQSKLDAANAILDLMLPRWQRGR